MQLHCILGPDKLSRAWALITVGSWEERHITWPELKVTLQYKFSAGISLLSQAVGEETKRMRSQTLLSGPKFTRLNIKGNLNQDINNKKTHFQASKPHRAQS